MDSFFQLITSILNKIDTKRLWNYTLVSGISFLITIYYLRINSLFINIIILITYFSLFKILIDQIYSLISKIKNKKELKERDLQNELSKENMLIQISQSEETIGLLKVMLDVEQRNKYFKIDLHDDLQKELIILNLIDFYEFKDKLSSDSIRRGKITENGIKMINDFYDKQN